VLEKTEIHDHQTQSKTPIFAIMPKGFMYILKCSDNTYYTGSTKYLKTRIDQHNLGVGANYTAQRRPVTLVYYEEYEHIALAYNREKQIQNWSRKKKEAMILRDSTNLEYLSECQNASHWLRDEEE